MIKRRIGCLPVVDAGQLVGLISESDCLRLLSWLLVPEPNRGPLS